MAEVSVVFKALSEVARLVGRDGEASIDESGARPMLKGSFRLRLDLLGVQSLSEPELFGPGGVAAVARRVGSGWELAELARLTMVFPAAVRLRRSPRSALLTFTRALVMQAAGDAIPALISLDDMSLSLAPTRDPTGTRRFVHPTRKGWSEANLTILKHPQMPEASGLFLRRLDGAGIGVAAGGPADGANFDHAQVVGVFVGVRCNLLFRVLDGAGLVDGTLIHDAVEPGSLAVIVKEETGLALQAAAPGLGRSRRAMKALHARDGLLSSQGFADDQMLLRRIEPAAALVPSPDGQTMLFGAAESFSFQLEIPEDAAFDAGRHRAEFRYESPIDGNASLEPDPWARFYGLRVAGLAGSRERQEVFDVSLASVRLMTGPRGFHFAAGGRIDGAASVVAPKPNPSRGGRRSTTLATSTLSLRLDELVPADKEGDPLEKRGAEETYLVLRTAERRMELQRPLLAGPPAGLAAGAKRSGANLADAAEPTDAFHEWLMRLPKNVEQKLTLAVQGNDQLEFLEGWVEPFVTLKREFKLLEQPGAGIEIVGSGPSEATGPWLEGTKTGVDVVAPGSLKQGLVYSAAAIALALYPFRKDVEAYMKEGEAFLDSERLKLGYSFADMSAEELQRHVASRQVGQLQFGFLSTGPDDPANRFLVQFIEDNRPPEREKPIRKFHLSLQEVLSVLLFDGGDVPATKRYAHQIMHARVEDNDAPETRPKPGIVFNLGREAAVDPARLGWTEADWRRLAREQPALWPRKSAEGGGVEGGRLDPSAAGWVGVMLRDMPASLVIPPEVLDVVKVKWPMLASMYETLTNNLRLFYGWVDASGPTWYVTLGSPTGYDFTPDAWKSFLTFRLESVGLAGAAGSMVGGEGKLSLQLNRITDSSNRPLTVTGRFRLNVTIKEPISVIELAIDNNPDAMTTTAIPGFDQVKLTGLTTDLKTAMVRLELQASAGLAAALPIFRSDRPTPASMVLNLSGEPQSDVQLSIPTDKDTNLFGRFPLTIQGIYLQFGVAGPARNQMLIRGRLGLGLAGLEAVGADVIMRQTDSGWDFDIHINEIAVALSLGDGFRVAGLLSWAPDDIDIEELSKPGGFKRPLDGPRLPVEGDKRDFWAILALKTNSFMGDLDLLLKIGSQGERNYWIGAARSSKPIKLGSAQLEAPAILLAHNADFGGKLREYVTNPFKEVVVAIRPPDGDPEDPGKDLSAKREWLKKWRPSNDIGAVIAGSGYLHFWNVVAESPRTNERGGPPKYLTALVATDSGMFRLDAQTMFMKSKIIGFGIAIDIKNKILSAGIRLPEIATPDDKNPKYVISPGNMSMALRYGPGPAYFAFNLGWPRLRDGSDIERDWSQSTRIYIAELFPINTFWGGFRAELDAGKNSVRIGYAIRAGWTWKAELNGADIAKASAEVGITLGGVIEFIVTWDDGNRGFAPLPPPHQMAGLLAAPSRALSLLPFDALASFHGDDTAAVLQALTIMDAATDLTFRDLEVIATIYGDIWGKGSVEFLGITLASIDIALRLRLQVCGGLKRGITRMYGRGEIEVKVTILCVSFTGRAGFDLWIKRGDCAHNDSLSDLFSPLPFDALADLRPPPALADAAGVSAP